jgi:hypothetical protein
VTTPPFLKPRYWDWEDQSGNRAPGVGLFRGADLKAHLTPGQARALADKLHDMADRIESRETP